MLTEEQTNELAINLLTDSQIDIGYAGIIVEIFKKLFLSIPEKELEVLYNEHTGKSLERITAEKQKALEVIAALDTKIADISTRVIDIKILPDDGKPIIVGDK